MTRMLHATSLLIINIYLIVHIHATSIFLNDFNNVNFDISSQMQKIETNVKWLDDLNVLEMLRLNSSDMIIIDTRNSNEYNGWKSFEKIDHSSDLNVFNGHFKNAYNFEIEWLFNFNEISLNDVFLNRIGLVAKDNQSLDEDSTILSQLTTITPSMNLDLKLNSSETETNISVNKTARIVASKQSSLPLKHYQVLIYDTKLERLEAMRDYLLNKYKLNTLLMFKIIDKKILFDLMTNLNVTDLIEYEPQYDLVISPEYLYSILFNPLAAITQSSSLPSYSSSINHHTVPVSTNEIKKRLSLTDSIQTSTINSNTILPSAVKQYKLFDVSYGDENQFYINSHIPTSVHLDTNEIEEAPLWNRRNRTQLIQLLANLGIKANNTDLIILYGNPDPMASYRVAVIFKWLGVNNVHVLNGGYKTWLRKNYPIEKKINKRNSIMVDTEYENYFNNKIDASTLIVDLDFVTDIVKNHNTFSDQYSLIDIRTWKEYVGEIAGYSDINTVGRISGALWGKAGSSSNQLEEYRNLDMTMRSADDIRKMWNELGIDYENKHLIFYCGKIILKF